VSFASRARKWGRAHTLVLRSSLPRNSSAIGERLPLKRSRPGAILPANASGRHVDGGSRGIRTSQDYIRRGGAAARIMLLQAAANEWNVPVGDLTVASGIVTHKGSGRTTSYGKLAAAAAKLTPPDPKGIQLKNPRDWKIAGKPMMRLDTADKVNGAKIFAIDQKLPAWSTPPSRTARCSAASS